MRFFENGNRKVLMGVVLGVAAAGLVRSVRPAFHGLGRPLAKATIKSGIVLYERGRETLAQAGEVFEDLVAEARAEMEGEAPAAMQAGSGGVGNGGVQ